MSSFGVVVVFPALMIMGGDLQAMVQSVRMAPHPSSLQDVLLTWHALKALPSQLSLASQHLNQQLMHTQMGKQPLVRALADAKAELMACLNQVEGDLGVDGSVAHAFRACLLAAADELKVSESLLSNACHTL